MLEGSETPGTPAWWLNFLGNRFLERDKTYDLQDDLFRPMPFRTRRQRLNLLWSYYIGQPPMPQVAEEYTETFRQVLRKGRATYAPMAITPMLDRMEIQGLRTGASDGPEGDGVAKRIMTYSNFAAAIKDALTYLFTMSEAYLMVVPAEADALDQTPLITAEDPRLCIGQPDPLNPNRLQAALKIGFDPLQQKVIAWLFVDGKRYQASRPAGISTWLSQSFPASSFEWDNNGEPVEMPQLAGIGDVPVVQLVNARHMGEYEPHLDVLDRINDTILQRVVITWYQSFRQRAIIGDLESAEEDEDAPIENIDWTDVFRASPGALWRVPEKTTFWESSQADLTPIINSIKSDVQEFAAVTQTPLHLVTPDAAQGSAEGAALLREGLVFKVRDRRARVEPRLMELFKIAFAFAGAPERADSMEFLWGPNQAFSLTEKAQAIAQTRGVLSRERQLEYILEMTPEEAQLNMQELIYDQIIDQQLTTPPPPTTVRLTENVTQTSKGSGQPLEPLSNQVP